MKLIHQDASEESLQFLRTFIFGLWFIIIFFDQFPKLSYIPLSMFRPIGFLIKFLPDALKPLLLDIRFLYTLKAILLICLGCIIFNIFRKTTGVLACLCLTLNQGIGRSFGAINHAEISLLYAAFLLVAFDIADSLWKRNPNRTNKNINLNSIPFIGIMIVICTAYSLIGINRVVYGGIKLFQTEAMTIWAIQNTQIPTLISGGMEQLVFDNKWFSSFLKLGFVFSTAVEISAPFCLVSHWWRRIFICLMIPFHIFVWMFIGPDFWENILLYIVFIDFTGWLAPRHIEGKSHPIVFYDGVCGLCNRFVQWLLPRDRTGIFQFAPLQGETATKIIGKQNTDAHNWTLILYDENKKYERSEAALRIIRDLGGNWRIIAGLRILPLALRDFVYKLIARYRYQFFGKLNSCPLPKKEYQNRFLS